jgi:hypothetical protein
MLAFVVGVAILSRMTECGIYFLGTVGLLKNLRLLRRPASLEDDGLLAMTKCAFFFSLRAWPQGADSENRVAISNVTNRLFQQPHSSRLIIA